MLLVIHVAIGQFGKGGDQPIASGFPDRQTSIVFFTNVPSRKIVFHFLFSIIVFETSFPSGTSACQHGQDKRSSRNHPANITQKTPFDAKFQALAKYANPAAQAPTDARWAPVRQDSDCQRLLLRGKEPLSCLLKTGILALDPNFSLDGSADRGPRRFSCELGEAALVDLFHDRLDVHRFARVFQYD